MPALAGVLLLANVPWTRVGRAAREVGLGQTWNVYAPNPVDGRLAVVADVDYADGHTATWRIPHRSALLADGVYHWDVWAIRLSGDRNSRLWRPAALWIARHAQSGGRPVRVTLMRRWAPLPPPGQSSRPLLWNEFDFYSTDLGREP